MSNIATYARIIYGLRDVNAFDTFGRTIIRQFATSVSEQNYFDVLHAVLFFTFSFFSVYNNVEVALLLRQVGNLH